MHVDVPTVAPGWPNVHSSNSVSTDSIMSCDQVAVNFDKELTERKVNTAIGMLSLSCV